MQKKETKEQLQQVLALLNEVIQYDEGLRKQYNIDDKFRFVREQLQALFVELETAVKSVKVTEEKPKGIGEDETHIYIYLFNAQGITVRSWLNMFSQTQFNEYVFNRPIYADQQLVEALIRSKTNKVQHAYLTVIIKKESILPSSLEKPSLDSLGNPLIKIKEASLRFKNMVSFKHNDIVYRLNEDGELVQL